MGGGSKVQQTNTKQAAPAFAGGTAAANNATNQGNTFSQQQQDLYNMLWGKPTGTGGMTSSGGGGEGALRNLLNPNSLNVSSPTGVFALQNTNANNTAAQQYGQNAGAITSAAQQAGFGPGTPSGFVADQQNKNARALADTKGSNFLNSTQANYNANLNNFWNAANMAQSGSQAAGAGANQAQGTAAGTYANLYGTAGHGNVTQNSNLLGNMIAAGGQVGAAAAGCICLGTKVRTGAHIVVKVEDLRLGDSVIGVEGKIAIIKQPQQSLQDCVAITTESGHELHCSVSHTMLRPLGGYVRAGEAMGVEVLTWSGKDRIVEVKPLGQLIVVRLELDGSHTYLSGNIWSEE